MNTIEEISVKNAWKVEATIIEVVGFAPILDNDKVEAAIDAVGIEKLEGMIHSVRCYNDTKGYSKQARRALLDLIKCLNDTGKVNIQWMPGAETFAQV